MFKTLTPVAQTHVSCCLCDLIHRYPERQQVDNRNAQMTGNGIVNGRMGSSHPNQQDRPEQRPSNDADGRVLGQSAKPLDRPGFQSGPNKPYGEDIDGRRSPPRRISLDDPRDKVGDPQKYTQAFYFF